MQLEFKSLSLEGFKSINKPLTLHFSGRGAGVHFVRGENKVDPELGANGSGKSSLWDGLSWTLFGKTVEGLRNPDIEAWLGGATEGELALVIDGKTYRINRKTKPNLLTLNGTEVGQERINSLIGMDSDTFWQVVLFGQDQPLFLDKTPADKLSLLSTVLDLGKWEDRSDRASEKAKDYESAMSAGNGELVQMIHQEEELGSMLATTIRTSKQWEEERRQRMEGGTRAIAELKPALKKWQKQKDEADLALESASTELRALPDQIRKAREDLAIIDRNIRDLKYETDTHEATIHRMEQEIITLGSTDNCPTCGQLIKGTRLGRHKKELQDQVKKMKAMRVGVPSGTLKKAASQKAVITILEASQVTYQDKVDQAQTSLNFATQQLAQVESRINSIKGMQREREDEVNPHRATIDDLKSRQKQLTIDIEAKKKSLVFLERRIKRTRAWVAGFKEVRLYVIKEVLQELELATMAMLPMVGLADWKVEYDIEKENKTGGIQRKLHVNVLSPGNDKAVRWESWSGGEKQRLRLVGAFALAEVLMNHAGVQSNLEILDEPTHNLSESGVRSLCSFLAERAARAGKVIYFVDHVAIESAHFASTQRIVKTNKGSVLLEV